MKGWEKGVKVKDNKVILNETRIKGQIKGYLKLQGVFFYHNLQGLGCCPGIPDLAGFHKGYAFFVEVKSKRGKLSEFQEKFKKEVELENAIVFVPHSYEEFVEEWKMVWG